MLQREQRADGKNVVEQSDTLLNFSGLVVHLSGSVIPRPFGMLTLYRVSPPAEVKTTLTLTLPR